MGPGVIPDRRRVLGVGGVVRAVRADLMARRALQGRPPLPQSVAGIRESCDASLIFSCSFRLCSGGISHIIPLLIVFCLQAGNCADAEVIYRFLEANQIGQGHAIYYMAYASLMESKNKLRKANEIFDLGIAR